MHQCIKFILFWNDGWYYILILPTCTTVFKHKLSRWILWLITVICIMINWWWCVQQCWIKASSHKRWRYITTFNNTSDRIVWCYRAATVYHSIRTVWSATICYRQLWFLWHVWKQTQTRYNHVQHFIRCYAIHNKQLPRLTKDQKFISCHLLQKRFPPLPSLRFLLSHLWQNLWKQVQQ